MKRERYEPGEVVAWGTGSKETLLLVLRCYPCNNVMVYINALVVDSVDPLFYADEFIKNLTIGLRWDVLG